MILRKFILFVSSLPDMEINDADIHEFIDILRSRSTYELSGYSEKSLRRRILKLLADHQLAFDDLITKIKRDADFLEKMVRDITVNTTELFRDPGIWKSIRKDIMPRYSNQANINIWHAGCSTGQEVFSMMILLSEMGLFERSRIFATDINPDVLDKAAEGSLRYKFHLNYLKNFDQVIKQDPANDGKYRDVPYSRYFTIDHIRDLIIMHPFLLEKPCYKKHDLVREGNPFPYKYDLIVCRNVIIYFKQETQDRIFRMFLENMHEGGCLILGVHESILGTCAPFFDKKDQMYFKK